MSNTSWYTSKGSGGQGLVIAEDTGRTIAVTYDEKDARLIAAAPELLEAVKEFAALLDPDQKPRYVPMETYTERWQSAHNALKAAIAKAEEDV